MLFLCLNLLSVWAAIAFSQSVDLSEYYDDDMTETSIFETNAPLQRNLEEEVLGTAGVVLEGVDLPDLRIQNVSSRFLFAPTCLACRTFINAILKAARIGATGYILKRIIRKICSILQVELHDICKSVIDLNFDTIFYIVKQKPSLSAAKVCSILLQQKSCKDPNNPAWTINIPNKKSDFHYRSIAPNSQAKPLKILQITDIHYDPGYTEGSNADCGKPLCCQRYTKPASPRKTAGFWGDYRKCDTPWQAIEDAVDHILVQHKDIDLVYFVGDIINHSVWATTQSSNSQTLSEVYSYINHKFRHIPIYYILGNHEPHPCNVFAPVEITEPHLSTNWLFELAVDHWNLPKHTYKTILQGGYYTTLVKPGFRIVALNSNVCYILNWWLLYNDVDPYGQLKWLVKVLSQAEKDEEIVHILSHIPTNNKQCLQNWAKEYVKIIKRFSNIIPVQFNGHTHFDEFVVYFDYTNRPYRPYSTALNGGSLTTYENLNPNYKIYHVDPTNLEVLDAESWSYDITEANLTPDLRPNWYKLYSFQQEFGQSPSSMGGILINKLAKNASAFQKYFRFKNRGADPAILEGCNKYCRRETLCEIMTPYLGYKTPCQSIKQLSSTSKSSFDG